MAPGDEFIAFIGDGEKGTVEDLVEPDGYGY